MILVTGANGFIGQHLCRSLLDDGCRVRGLLQSEAPLYFVERDEVEWRQGDLADPASLAGITQGAETVYHLGAIPRNDLHMTRADFEAINVRGTEVLLKEAAASGVGRFVYVSTAEAAGYGNGTDPRREDDEPHPDNNYGRSKLAAEKIVLNGRWPMECVVIRLPMIYGPGTFLIVPKLFGTVRRGFYPLIGSGETLMEFCYVANAVTGLRLAGERADAVGEVFYVSDERSYSIREVVSAIARSMDKWIVFISVPPTLAYLIALFWEFAARLMPVPPLVARSSRKPFLTRETVRWTTRNVNFVSTGKIRSLLGYRPRVPIDEGCMRTTEWLRGMGWRPQGSGRR